MVETQILCFIVSRGALQIENTDQSHVRTLVFTPQVLCHVAIFWLLEAGLLCFRDEYCLSDLVITFFHVISEGRYVVFRIHFVFLIHSQTG